jgi:hypothetical protein
VGRFGYRAPPVDFDYIKAIENKERTLYPHHLLISLLQGPCKTQLKLALIDRRIDSILGVLC